MSDPGPRKATAVQLVFMTSAVICSGAYGLEEMVSASGPGLSMVVLLVLPLLYAAPISLTCAELSARNRDKALSDLLASQGITFNTGSTVAPAPASMTAPVTSAEQAVPAAAK